MFWYLILSFLFSLGISLTTIEMYFSNLPMKKQYIIFAIALIIGMIIWPLLLVFIDGAIIWNTILRIKYSNEVERPTSVEETTDEEK